MLLIFVLWSSGAFSTLIVSVRKQLGVLHSPIGECIVQETWLYKPIAIRSLDMSTEMRAMCGVGCLSHDSTMVQRSTSREYVVCIPWPVPHGIGSKKFLPRYLEWPDECPLMRAGWHATAVGA